MREQFVLRNILEVDYLQAMQDSFASTFSLPTVIVDPMGVPVTKPSHWQIVCDRFAGDMPDDCRKRFSALTSLCGKTKAPALGRCPHSGLITVAVPIVLDRCMLGAWILDQALVDDCPEPDMLFDELPAWVCGRKGFDDGKAEPRIVSRSDFERMFSLLMALNRSVVRLGQKNRDMAIRDRQLSAVHDQMDAANAMLRKFIDSSHVAMYICDYHTGELVMMNRAYCRMFKKPMEEMIGKKCWHMNGNASDCFCAFCPRGKLLDDNGNPADPHTWVYFNTNVGLWLKCTHQAIAWTQGRLAHMVTILDVTQEYRLQERLRHLAFVDRQTMLPNGQKLLQDIREFARSAHVPAHPPPGPELLAHRDSAGDFDLVCLDLSSLRKVAEEYGRETVTELLRSIAHWILGQDFGNATLYRVDGDQFCLAIQGASEDDVATAANRIMARFAKPWQIILNGRESPCFCSVHTALLLTSCDKLLDRDVLALINRALDAAKRRKRPLLYDEEQDGKFQDQLRLETSLVACVNKDMAGFEVKYQPIVSLKAQTWTGLEALCRWTSPEFGAVPPTVFISHAERLGVIVPLGEWVLETSVRQSREWGLDNREGFFLSVNISPLQIMDETFAAKVADILERHNFPGSKLNLEVTESGEIAFTDYIRSVIAKLRALGVHLALDDFGTGYSSFNNLKNLPVTFLKTDGEFVRGIESDSHTQYLFYVMSEISHANGMRLIAEGIETLDQLRAIKKNGADYIQGFYFAEPMSAAGVAANLERFASPDDRFLNLPEDEFDLVKWLDGTNAYTLTPCLLKLQSDCIQTLLSEAGLGESFQTVLARMGDYFRLDRAYVFVKDKEAFNPIHEWCAPGARPLRERLPAIRPGGISESLMNAFRRDGMVVSGDIQTLPQGMLRLARPDENHAHALMPMWDGEELIGFVGIGHHNRHAWTPDAIIMLHNIALVMANTIKREVLKTHAKEKRHMIAEILNRSDMNAFIADINTSEIIWVNDTLEYRYGIRDQMLGKKCHQVVNGTDEPCPGCHLSELLANPESEIPCRCNREEWGQFFVHDTVVEWEPGRLVHVVLSLDLARPRLRDSRPHLTDRVTGMANRHGMMIKVENAVRQAVEWKEPLSFAYVKARTLRRINDVHGFDAGDGLLRLIAQSIAACTRTGDGAGRIGGDEFLVVFPNCRKHTAKARMDQARLHLAQQPPVAGEEIPAFNFAVVDLDDTLTGAGDFHINRLLTIAKQDLHSQIRTETETREET